MTRKNIALLIGCLVGAAALGAAAPASQSHDLAKIVSGDGWHLVNRAATSIEDGARTGIRLDERAGNGIAWLEAAQPAEVTIELDIRGKDVPQRSFVGVAFNGVDDETWDAVYFRPFNFKSPNSDTAAHSVQYVSHPAQTWQKLRAERPNQYEQPVRPVPDPNGWFHARIVVAAGRVRVYADGAAEPCLDVEKLGNRGPGRVGLFVGNGSGGDFAGLRIVPAESQGPADWKAAAMGRTACFKGMAPGLFAGAPAGDIAPSLRAEGIPAAEPIVRAERITIHSAVLGEDRELRIAKPADYDRTDAAYPVLYVLDAESNFPFTAEVARFLGAYSLIPRMIVVGVVNTDRVRDMTPNRLVPPHERYATAGGADRFLRFLGEEAIPLIEKSYRAQPSRAIVGHSLSGLLVIHALLAAPDLFADYIAVSPSLWWNDYECYSKIRSLYESRASLPKSVWVSLADESEKEPERYEKLREAFETSPPKDLDIKVRFFKQDNHITTAVTSTLNALITLYAGRGAPSVKAAPPGRVAAAGSGTVACKGPA